MDNATISPSAAADGPAAEPGRKNGPALVLYDGDCGLCNWAVQLIWKHDPRGRFFFAPIQSEGGRERLARHGVPNPKLDTFFLLEEGRLLERSDAALQVCRQLEGWPRFLALFRPLPRELRNAVYDLVARNRHKLSAKAKTACEVPPPNVRQRFLQG